MAVLRGERPELAVRAAEHASGLLAVLRASLAERPRSAEPEAESGAAEPAEEPAPERVQKIALRRRGPGSEA
jgi:hypothetical protein